jgi:hypothetical protein
MRFWVSTAVSLYILIATLVAAMPSKLSRKVATANDLYVTSASFIIVVDEAEPWDYGTILNGQISSSDNSDEKDTFVSFSVPPMSAIKGATLSSLCQVRLVNPTSKNGTAAANVYPLVSASLTASSTFNFLGEPPVSYSAAIGTLNFDDSDIVGTSGTFDCGYGSNMQFEMTPFGIATIEFTQSNTTGLFLVVLDRV